MSQTYHAEADALDAEILTAIAARRVPDFDALALRIFVHQLRYNEPYARYCASLGFTPARMPRSWDAVPPVPAGAFKEAALCTFDPAAAALTFETSGTTSGTGGVHYMESARLYDASLEAGFQDAMLSEGSPPLRYLMLLPAPGEKPRSSLSYMMDRVAQLLGDGRESWYVRSDEIDAAGFSADVRAAATEGAALCIAGTAFAFVRFLDDAPRQMPDALALPSGSRIMVTGGFKGRTRVVERGELYRRLARLFALPAENVIEEYGMTELTTQYYDESFDISRRKAAQPWLKSYAVDESGAKLPAGVVGALVHVDLANRSSCVAILTEDLGAVFDDGSLVLIGRESGAELRGCSLDAESLRAAVT